jgi:hypothetical protein
VVVVLLVPLNQYKTVELVAVETEQKEVHLTQLLAEQILAVVVVVVIILVVLLAVLTAAQALSSLLILPNILTSQSPAV